MDGNYCQELYQSLVVDNLTFKLQSITFTSIYDLPLNSMSDPNKKFPIIHGPSHTQSDKGDQA